MPLAQQRKGVKDDKLHVLFNNLEQFVHKVAKTHAYKAIRIAMGVHYENMVFLFIFFFHFPPFLPSTFFYHLIHSQYYQISTF